MAPMERRQRPGLHPSLQQPIVLLVLPQHENVVGETGEAPLRIKLLGLVVVLPNPKPYPLKVMDPGMFKGPLHEALA